MNILELKENKIVSGQRKYTVFNFERKQTWARTSEPLFSQCTPVEPKINVYLVRVGREMISVECLDVRLIFGV